MRYLVLFTFVISALVCFAGNKKLSDGTVVFWEDQTEVIQYNSYRAVVELSERSAQNVWGDVELTFNGKVHRGSLFISAGERRGSVDFEGLENGRRYHVNVTIRNK